VWDALRSDRPYRKAWSDHQVRNYLLQKAGSQFDPLIVKIFVRMMWGE
jgi:HD-GYP domain-containing protein (c-di-GMP phosphodiesterase class II)